MFINLLCIPLTIATQKGVLYLFYIQFWQILSTDIFRGHGEPFDYGKESIKIRKSNEVAGTAFFISGKRQVIFCTFLIYMEDAIVT